MITVWVFGVFALGMVSPSLQTKREAGAFHHNIVFGHSSEILPISGIRGGDIALDVELPAHSGQFQNQFQSQFHHNGNFGHDIAVPQILTNSVEKPVDEPQEYVPPQSVGTAVIPRMPPPATPINAVASNVPAENGAVFIGSGSLGVVNLGNGAFALGSGSIGYSGNRQQPRPNGMSPLYPPLPATPDLIPAAAIPNQPPLPTFPPQPQPPPLDFNHPLLNIPRPNDANGYEFFPPNRAGFGMPLQRLPMLKTRNAFATPTSTHPVPTPPQILPEISGGFRPSNGFDSHGFF